MSPDSRGSQGPVEIRRLREEPSVLRIGIDARPILRLRTGVERMLWHFVENLQEHGLGQEYVLFLDGEPGKDFASRCPHRIVVEPVRYLRLQRFIDVWILRQVGELIEHHGIDLFFSPHTKFPQSGVPRFTTVHGVEWHYCPSDFALLERMKQWGWFRLAVRHSAGIVSFAENTRTDIRKMSPGLHAPVCVSHEGVDPMFRRLDRAEKSRGVLDRLGIDRPFILSVCRLDPRKNLDALLRAFAISVRERDVPHVLVLAGKPGRKAEELRALSGRLGLANRVRFTGFLGDEDIVQLYNQADLFAYPSKYEGFGLPLLEAMACGVPVLTSRGSALAEVAGDAAILVDPYSDPDIATGILRGLLDESLRSRLVDAGLDRVARFSWEKMTARICEFMITEYLRDGRERTTG